MSEWWILVLVVLNFDGTITTKIEDRFNYHPSCQIAAEARQMYNTANFNTNKNALGPISKMPDSTSSVFVSVVTFAFMGGLATIDKKKTIPNKT